jgi:replicative DNA helicase
MASVFLESKREQFLERPLPSSEEAERIVLGCILLDNLLMLQAAELLKVDDFYSPRHRKIFAAMLGVFGRGEPLEPVLIGEELKKESLLESIGGVATITNLTYGLPHMSDLSLYIGIVKKKKLARDLVRVCNDIVSETLNEEEEVEDTLERAERQIFALSDFQLKKGFSKLGVVAREMKAKAEEFSKRETHALLGLATGLRDLDEKTGGLQKSDLIIVAGRPSMGKTTLVLNFASNAARDENAVVAVFSLEMSKEQLAIKMTSAEAKVDSNRYRTGYLTQQEWGRISFAIDGVITESNIFIDDTPGISVFEMRSKARRLKAEQKSLDLIVVDYLQLMSGGRRTDSRQQEVALISRELKALAKELNVPVVALSQLSRAPEARNPPRPMMSDLRESGQIEADADVVAFIYREDYYKPDDENAGIAEIILAKQRNGPIGTVKVAFLKEFSRFENFFGE